MVEEQKRTGRAGRLILALAIVFLVGSAAMILYLRHAVTGASGRIASLLLGRPVSYDTSVPMVIEKIQSLRRLETVSYSMDTIVEGKRSSDVLPDLLFGDRLLLVVHGQAIAGVDLAKLKPEDVKVAYGAIHVELPASELFSANIDNQKTRVYLRTTGLFVPADQNLEAETRAKAEDQLKQAALKDGILDNAKRNAQATVTTMLNGLGFTRVDVK
jgi:hypothetical protein